MSLDQEWETSSGLPLDGADVTVTAMEFGYNASIGAGVVCANFTFVDEDGVEYEQSFSIGKNGEPTRDGSEVTGAPKMFPARTNYGRLIDSVRALVDHPGEVIGSPKKAEGWIGTKWTVGTVPVETTNPNATDPATATKVKDAFVFTQYLGKEGQRAAKNAAAKTKAAAKPAKAAAKNVEPDEPDEDEAEAGAEADTDVNDEPWSVLGVDETLWKRLVKMAKAADSHDEFSDEALEIADVDKDKAAQKAVLTTKPGSVWHFVYGDG